ncbi:unnamed protein product [Amoebophrya sp. A120]|nr:unnamed protein product [Amoebophrya sp. A120]|eukprot:GSA120T00019847001.1
MRKPRKNDELRPGSMLTTILSSSKASKTTFLCLLLSLLHNLEALVQQASATQFVETDEKVEDWWYDHYDKGLILDYDSHIIVKKQCQKGQTYDIDWSGTGAKIFFPIFFAFCIGLVVAISFIDKRETSDGRVLSRKDILADEKLHATEVQPSAGDATARITSTRKRATYHSAVEENKKTWLDKAEGESQSTDAAETGSDENSTTDSSAPLIADATALQNNSFSFGLGAQLVSTKENMREIGATNFESKGDAKEFLNTDLSARGNGSTRQSTSSVVRTKSDLREGGKGSTTTAAAEQDDDGDTLAKNPLPLPIFTDLYWEFVNRPQKERLYFLDFGRTLAIMCVVTEHGGSRGYAEWNVFGALNWVLPFLYLISGWCYVLSHAPLLFYILRLSAVFAIGVGANFVADWINDGSDVKFSQGQTIYQMTFVLMLIMNAILTYPVRRMILWRYAHPFGVTNGKMIGLTAVYGAIALATTVIYSSGILEDADVGGADTVKTLTTHAIGMAEFFGILFLVALAMCLGTTRHLAYILIIFTWVIRWFLPMDLIGFVHLVKIYVYGMVMCKFLPYHNDFMKNILFRTYWPFTFMFIVFLQMPDYYGRCDLYPRYSAFERARWYTSELLIVLWFSSGAMNTADPYRLLPVLGNWALFAYVFHEFFHRTIPIPYGAFTVLCLMFVFVFFAKVPLCGGGKKSAKGGRRKSKENDEPPKPLNLTIPPKVSIGVVVQDFTGEITAIQPDGWAAKNGLKVGDSIRKIEAGGRTKTFMDNVPLEMSKEVVAKRAMLHYERPLQVTVAPLPEKPARGAKKSAGDEKDVETPPSGEGSGRDTQQVEDAAQQVAGDEQAPVLRLEAGQEIEMAAKVDDVNVDVADQ